MRFGSVCSGIEAASVAWHPIGWQAAWLAEIEPFPSAVLAHHYPDVPNLGDMTKLPERILSGEIEAPDVFCGGTPCQAFSVAGERRSLDDARGNLSLTFCEIADAIDHVRSVRGEQPAVVFWENVPGVLSTKDNAFGCFLAGLAGEVEALKPSGDSWTDAGCVLGPKRTIAWRILDAQYFGLAQRRRRVFVVASARDGFDPTAVLFESNSVRRDTAPSREAWQRAAHTIAGCSNGGGANGPGRDVDSVESLQVIQAFGGNNQAGPIDVATARNACASASGRMDFESETFLVQPVTYDFFNITAPVNRQSRTPGDPCHTLARSNAEHAVLAFHPTQDPISSTDVCHTIGTGSGQGCATAAIAFAQNQRDEVQNCLRASQGGGDKPHVLCEAVYNQGFNHESNYASTQETHAGKVLRTLREAVGEEAFAQWGLGILDSLQPTKILRQALHGLSVRPAAFSRSWVVHCTLSCSKNRSGWLLQSLREAGCERCASQGWQPPEQLARELGAYLSELSQPGAQAGRFVRDLWWAAQGPGVLRQALSAVQKVGRPTHGQGQPAHEGLQVRRLTVEECEFLQGVPRGYTAIPWRNKPADQCPDGPRYKALGNSWAVPVVRWIGQRINDEVSK